MKIIDISRELLSTPVYPGDPETRVQNIRSIEMGDLYNLNALYTSLHTGTHVDAPLHFLEDGESIDAFPLEKFMGSVTVVTLPHGPITGEVVEQYFPKHPTKLILRTKSDNVFFGGAAEDIASLGYDLLGYDRPALGGDNEAACHRALLSGGTVLLENLDLSDVEHDGEYYLVALPLKADGLEASPVRAVLLEQDKGF